MLITSLTLYKTIDDIIKRLGQGHKEQIWLLDFHSHFMVIAYVCDDFRDNRSNF